MSENDYDVPTELSLLKAAHQAEIQVMQRIIDSLAGPAAHMAMRRKQMEDLA